MWHNGGFFTRVPDFVRNMGNQHTHDKPEAKKSGGVLTSVQQLEEWLPDSVKKIEQGTLEESRDVQDWEDENVVEKATQLNTIQNIVEERKTMKRTNSPDTKSRLFPARCVSFSTFEREEHTFDSCCDADLYCSSEDSRGLNEP